MMVTTAKVKNASRNTGSRCRSGRNGGWLQPLRAFGVAAVCRNNLLALAFVGLGFTTSSADAAIVVDNATSIQIPSTSPNPMTFSHTVSGTNRLLLVSVASQPNSADGTIEAVTGIDYGGQPLVFVGVETQGTDNARIEIWQLVNPPAGPNTVAITFNDAFNDPTNGEGASAGAVSFTGVDQTTPLGTFVSATNSCPTCSEVPTVIVSSAAGELVFDTVARKGNSVTVGPGQAEQWNRCTDAGCSNVGGGASTEPGAASVTMSWTPTNDRWAIGAVPIKPALAAHWPFDEGTGLTAADVSGNGNDGTLINGPTWACLTVGNALDFDGIDDHVDSATTVLDPATTPFTVTAWINATNFDELAVDGDVATIVQQMSGSGNGRVWLQIVRDSSSVFTLSSFVGNAATTTTTNFGALTGTWKHVALVSDGTTLRLYVDAVEEGSSTPPSIEPADGVMRIGRHQSPGDRLEEFRGSIDDVRIYDRALSAAEISGLAASAPTGCAPQTVAVTGTITPAATEPDIAAGLKTIVLTLTGDTWVAAGATFDAQRQAIINGLDSAQSETTGWNTEVRDKQGVAGVVRSSDTVVTITLDAQTAYDVTANETITVTVPAAALVTSGSALVATPTFDITAGAGPVGHWNFDEGSGQTAADSSGNGHNGTLGSTAGTDADDPTWTCVVGGNALTFDGTNDWVNAGDIDDIDGATKLTVTAWVKSADISAHKTIIRKTDGVNTWQFRQGEAPGSGLRVSMGGQTPDGVTANGLLSAGVWGHWTMVFDGAGATNDDRLKIYLDGIDRGPLTFANGPIPAAIPDSGTAVVEIGQHDFFNGVIDDMRIYDRLLTPAEISALVASPPTDCGTISGTVYEDVNYGGGVGRDLATATVDAPAFTIERDGVTVELYDAAGSYISNTTTAGGGLYSFAALTPANYTVRVVNTTVASTRVGSTGAEVAVQTYRIDGDGESVGTGANKVGGEQPIDRDSPANDTTQTLADLQALANQFTQSIVTVDASGGDVTGIDFGFNVDTVVNTNNADQGSLRQFILNANLLTDNAALAQNGRAAGVENSIFMIPGAAEPLGRPVDPGYNAAPLSYTIAPTAVLQTITDPVVLDGTTQADFAGAPIIELNGTGAGVVDGITITGGNNTIRGLVINRFGVRGIWISGASATNNLIAGNYIGINVAGTAAAANTSDGIRIDGSPSNTIGGTTAADRNVIAGNGDDNVDVKNTSGIVIQGNYVGTNATGTAGLGANGGVLLDNMTGSTVGGTTAGARNLISGNQWGVRLDNGSTGNVVQGNYIGTDVNGTAPIANTTHGVGIRNGALNNTIGGTATGAANLIAFNAIGVGLEATAGAGISILSNQIHSNTVIGPSSGIGIDLNNDGVTVNDAGDLDAGSNDLLNFPEITSASENAGTVDVYFDLDLIAGDYRIEFFTNPSGADPTGNGEGEVYTSFVVITHIGSGVESFFHSFAGSAGDIITATATKQLAGPIYASTSEFSAAFTVTLFTPFTARWPLDETSGVIAADVDAGNDGTYRNGVLLNQIAACTNTGTGVHFDGVDNFVEVPHSPDYLIDEGTVTLWANIDAIGTDQAFFSKDSAGLDTGGHLTLTVKSGGDVQVRLESTTTSAFVNSAAVSSGTWFHVAFSWGSGGMALYLDGAAPITDPYIGGLGATSGGTGNFEPIAFGAGTTTSDNLLATPTSDHFAGYLDDVRIYNRALSLAEVQTLAGCTPGLDLVKRAFWPDGTPIPTGATIPSGMEFKFLLYINNSSGARIDVSVRDVLDPAFQYEPGTMRVDNSVGNCAAAACTALEEQAIFTAVNAAALRTDAVDGDVASYTGASSSVDTGNGTEANLQLDINANAVWAILFSAKMP